MRTACQGRAALRRTLRKECGKPGSFAITPVVEVGRIIDVDTVEKRSRVQGNHTHVIPARSGRHELGGINIKRGGVRDRDIIGDASHGITSQYTPDVAQRVG